MQVPWPVNVFLGGPILDLWVSVRRRDARREHLGVPAAVCEVKDGLLLTGAGWLVVFGLHVGVHQRLVGLAVPRSLELGLLLGCHVIDHHRVSLVQQELAVPLELMTASELTLCNAYRALHRHF